MGGNDWFPLHFQRLRRSKWWRRASDLARARNVMMWGEAYSAVPAGSLPDDDDELAEAAGFGMDVLDFLEHKVEIMSPWTLCSDGRWYHPTICEMVLETWDNKSASRKAAAERKRRSRLKARGGTGDHGSVTGDEGKVTGDRAKIGRDDDTQRGDDRQDREDSSAKASGPPATPADAFTAYNLAAKENDWGIAERLTEARRKKLQARLKENGWAVWLAALERVTKSEFLMGRCTPTSGRKRFKMDLDFLLQASSFQKLIEGKYDGGPGTDGGNGRRTEDLRTLHEAAVELADPDY